MTSGYNRVAAAPAWPSNGTGWIEQELCIEPLHVPVQYTLVERAHGEDMEEVEWIVSMSESSIVLKRKSVKVEHLPQEIPFEDFSDVVLWGALAFNEAGDVMVGLSLYSEKHDLQVPVCITADTEGLAARWTAWSQALGLEPKVLNASEDLRDPFHGMSKLKAAPAQPRRIQGSRLERETWDGHEQCLSAAHARRSGGGPLSAVILTVFFKNRAGSARRRRCQRR